MRYSKIIKNKGFSLVEILGVIVILGVILGIAIPTTSILLNNFRKNYYTEQEKMMIQAAQAYMNDNKNLMPKELGQSVIVPLKDLYESKYLNTKITDRNGEKCFYNEENNKDSYVKIYKYNNNSYSYEGYLNCPECGKEKCASSLDEDKPFIDIKYPVLDDDNFINSQVSVEMKGSNNDDNVNLVSYSYRVYSNGILSFNSGVKSITGTNKSIKKEIGSYLPSKLKITVTATNEKGFSKILQKSNNSFVNLKAAQIGEIIYDPPFPKGVDKCDNRWVAEDNPKSVSVQCLDRGTGCAQPEFSNVFTKDSFFDTGHDLVKMTDGKGNVFNAKVLTCIDGKEPTCDWSDDGESTSWTNGSRTIKAKCKDSKSGCQDSSKSTTISTTAKTKEISFDFKDKVGNTKTCTKTANIYVDKTPPTCGSWSGESTSWTSGSRTVSVGCIDSDSGCSSSSVSKTLTSNGTTETVSIKISDNVGNSTTCTKTVNKYIDKTAPSCGTWSGESTSWSTSRTLSVGCSDSQSGCTNSSVSKTITTEGKTANVSIQITDKVGNSTTCNKQAATIYIDKTPPTCGTWSGESESWSTSRTLSVGCSDSQSGCTNSSVSKTITTGGKTASVSIQISDKLGNTTTCTKSSAKVYIDNIPPTCGSWSGGSTSWTSGSRTISVGCSDSETGCSSSTVSKKLTTEGKTESVSLTISDKTGNSTTCTNTVNKYIDNTAPTATFSIEKKSGSYPNWFYVKGKDSASGLKPISTFKYCYVNKVSGFHNCSDNGYDDGELKSNFSKGASSDSAGARVSSAAKKIKAKYKLCDVAGNCNTVEHTFSGW